ncbi:precorrin-3B synthase [Methylocapsa sp. D3K7]|uniref:precorrin-3B synthase n=1 Tax=Methylocapsa sp. D3K7 TaxID=3041435 RepID=UPI00244EBDFA|nr:precorrin-3B synthase [Methylocapsa sp. D3K7]WGJ15475.1 precorrin-3B synthase [Methylocapsa sp. D3K7]
MRKGQLHKGWCPGAWRPMPAKDGLLVRLRISCGTVGASTLHVLAQAGREHGNRIFELSNRGNMQIRGVRESNLPALIKTLQSLGLIDEDTSAEAVRNVLVSPLAGLDGRNDTLRAAKRLETMLSGNKNLHALPAKFGFLIDDGSSPSLGSIAADIRFDWISAAQSFAIGIGGRANGAVFLGYCSEDALPKVSSRLATAFLLLSSSMAEPPRRMAGLIASCGAHAIAAAAGMHIADPPERGSIAEPCPIGLIRNNGQHCFGVGVAFGMLDAAMLDAAATAASKFGNGEIRLTPWRAMIVPHVTENRADAIAAYFTSHRFLVDAEDERLSVAACGGGLTCEQGTTNTRADALSLMSIARKLSKNGIALHVSGCAKGCARQASTPVTLIARDGFYDLVPNETAREDGISAADRLSLVTVRDLLENVIAGKGSNSRGIDK